MKKIVVNMGECTYEKLCFEAMIENKSIQELIRERILCKPFSREAEKAYAEWMESELEKIIKG